MFTTVLRHTRAGPKPVVLGGGMPEPHRPPPVPDVPPKPDQEPGEGLPIEEPEPRDPDDPCKKPMILD